MIVNWQFHKGMWIHCVAGISWRRTGYWADIVICIGRHVCCGCQSSLSAVQFRNERHCRGRLLSFVYNFILFTAVDTIISLSVEEPLMWMPEFTISCAAEVVVERATTTLYSFNLAIVSTVTWVKLGLSVGSGGFHFLTVNLDVKFQYSNRILGHSSPECQMSYARGHFVQMLLSRHKYTYTIDWLLYLVH